MRLPWIQAGDFANRFGVDLALKDLRLAVDMAARRGIPAPVGAAGLMQLVQAHAQGLGRKDANAVYKTVRARRAPLTPRAGRRGPGAVEAAPAPQPPRRAHRARNRPAVPAPPGAPRR